MYHVVELNRNIALFRNDEIVWSFINNDYSEFTDEQLVRSRENAQRFADLYNKYFF